MLWSVAHSVACRASKPTVSQKGGKTTAAGLCSSLFPSVCVVATLKSDFRMCGFADKYKRYRLHFDHPWTQHHVISPYICSFVAAFVLGVVYIVVLEKGAAVVVFLQCRCACDEYRLPTFRPSNAQLTTYGPLISAGGTL